MNVKPHDLAIVVGCWDRRFNGATCVVLGPPPADLPVVQAIDSPYWSVRFGHPMPWTHGWRADLREGSFPDCWLRKIGGPDVPVGEEACERFPVPIVQAVWSFE